MSVNPWLGKSATRLAQGLVPAGLALWLGTIAPAGAADAERRCGWLENPTPGNWWLSDGHGVWIVAAQGGPYAEGKERLPTPTPGKFVATNGDYGYSCACLTGAFDPGAGRMTRLDEALALELSVCKADHNLPAP